MTQKEQLSVNNELISAYETSLGLPQVVSPGSEEELQEYLSMDRDVIEKLSAEKSIAISVRLSQFSFYLQRSINRNKQIIMYANHELTKIIAGEIQQYDKYTKHEIKVYQIGKQNSAAAELLKIRSYAEQIVERLSELAGGIRNLSYAFSMVFKSKIGERNE